MIWCWRNEHLCFQETVACVNHWSEILNSLLHVAVAAEPEADSDRESQDADRFIVQSTLGTIQDCIADDPDPETVDNDVKDKQVDEHISSFSTGLGEYYPLSGLTKLIWKLNADARKPYIVILSSNWFETITVKFLINI